MTTDLKANCFEGSLVIMGSDKISSSLSKINEIISNIRTLNGENEASLKQSIGTQMNVQKSEAKSVKTKEIFGLEFLKGIPKLKLVRLYASMAVTPEENEKKQLILKPVKMN